MRKRNLKLKSILKTQENNQLTNKVLERTLILKSLQLLRQSNFLVDFFYNKKSQRLKRKLCLVTSRSRAINQLTRTTRHVLKDYALNGYLYSFKKATW